MASRRDKLRMARRNPILADTLAFLETINATDVDYGIVGRHIWSEVLAGRQEEVDHGVDDAE